MVSRCKINSLKCAPKWRKRRRGKFNITFIKQYLLTFLSVFIGDNTRPVRLIVVFEDFLKELFSIFSVAEVHIADAAIINT